MKVILNMIPLKARKKTKKKLFEKKKIELVNKLE